MVLRGGFVSTLFRCGSPRNLVPVGYRGNLLIKHYTVGCMLTLISFQFYGVHCKYHENYMCFMVLCARLRF